jgi:hypothetical protein
MKLSAILTNKIPPEKEIERMVKEEEPVVHR